MMYFLFPGFVCADLIESSKSLSIVRKANNLPHELHEMNQQLQILERIIAI